MQLPTRHPRPHNPIPESPYEVLALFTGAMVGASIFIVGTGSLMTFFGSELHIEQGQLGLILSVQMLGSVVMTSVAGLLTDRFGDKTVVFWSGVFMGLALLAASLVASFTWLLFWLLMYGIGYAAVTPAGSHAIIFFFKKADRGLAMGVRQCGVPLAGAIGSILLPAIAARFEYRGALAAAGILTLAACWIASALYREPVELQGERVSVRAMLLEMITIARESRLILLTITSMVLICAQFALMGFLTLTYVHVCGYPVSLAVALFTLSQVAAIGGRLAWGWVSDHIFGGSRTLPLAVVCLLVAFVALGVAGVGATTPLWLAALFAIVLGFTAEGWLGVSVIGFAEIGGEEHSGSALGVGLTWTLLAAMLTPAIFGAVGQTHGFVVAWRGLAGLAALGIIPALLGSTALIANLRGTERSL
ncbi:MAG TPA: MFS transporter [Candidatus Cybelea sp.]|jgi:MFS family permease|nr:MFS transporter [Candidatus Cybelea sp.]